MKKDARANPLPMSPKKLTRKVRKLNLTPDDLQSWRKGDVLQSELATRYGVSVAAISKALKRIKTVTLPVTAPLTAHTKCRPGAPVPAGDSMLVQPIWAQGEGGFTEEDVLILAKSAAYGALLQANQQLTANTSIGPSALKAYASVIEWSVEQLGKLGVVSLDKLEQEQLPVLKIIRLTEEEQESLRSTGCMPNAQNETGDSDS